MAEYFQPLTAEHLRILIAIVGEEHISDSAADLDQHSRDQSFHTPHRPAVVVWPGDTSEISALLRYANQHRIPLTAWGAGSSLEGNPIPIHGGIVLDIQRMNEILEIRDLDFQVDVQAGVLYKDMNQALGRHGLFFAPDPGANASIGGMIANNAAGTRTPRYGATKDNVLRLEVVLASGEIIHTGTRSSKTSSGYDLLHLFVGSEGSLGVITQATLRLAPLPEKFSAAVATFSSTEDAIQAVTAISGSGITPAALEFLGPNLVKVLNTTGEFSLPDGPTLLLEFHSTTEAGLEEELSEIENLCVAEGCTTFRPGMGRAARNDLWRVRHQAYETIVRANPGRAFLVGDVAVAVSDYPRLVAVASQEMNKNNLHGYLIGHAGDGNLHPTIPYIPDDDESYAIAAAINGAIVEAAISMGGTATGEHGIGIGKRKFMTLEHGNSQKVMLSIKKALDPHGILNPGKFFIDELK